MSYLKYYTPSSTTRETYRQARRSSLNFEACGGERGSLDDLETTNTLPVAGEPIPIERAEELHALRRHARHVPRRTATVTRGDQGHHVNGLTVQKV